MNTENNWQLRWVDVLHGFHDSIWITTRNLIYSEAVAKICTHQLQMIYLHYSAL